MERPALRNRRGFTLIELVVALVISGILTSVIFQFLLDQGRFARHQSAREEVQQNTRAALELIASDLRGMPPRGLEVARQNSITFRAPRIWGVVCNLPNATTVHLAVPVAAGISYAAGSTNTHPGLIGQTGTGTELGTARTWLAQDKPVTAISQTPSSVCNGENLQAGTEMRTLTVLDTLGIVRRNPAYLFDRVTYATGTSNIPGNWILRRVGTDAVPSQPLAGPIRSLTEADQGLTFRYFGADGGQLFPPLDEANRHAVTRIEVTVEAISREIQGTPQSKLQRMSVSLRNRP